MATQIQYAQERAALARMEIALIRNTVSAYLPGRAMVDVIELRYIGAYLTIGAVEGRPMTVSKIMRALGMSRNTVVRRLDMLVAIGYVQRDGSAYTVTEKINLPNLRQVLDRNRLIISSTLKELSKLDSRN